MKTAELAGKRALVTGSTSGIGLAVAQALARAGARVMLHGSRPAADAEALRAALAAETGTTPGYLSANLADGAAARGLVEATLEAFGGLDILVNNAGIQHVAAVDAFPDENWAQMLAVNVSAVFHTTKAALPGMKAQGWGRIVNIASAHGLVASPFKAPYTATKHAVVGFSKAGAVSAARGARHHGGRRAAGVRHGDDPDPVGAGAVFAGGDENRHRPRHSIRSRGPQPTGA